MARGHATGPTVTEERVKVDRAAWIALAIVSLSLYMNVVDASAVNVAFPSVAADLGTSRSTLSWMISAYTITTASLLLVAGHLADTRGRRLVFTISLGAFVLGSAIAGVANSFEVLIVGRVIQGVGTAGVMPTSLALILPMFPLQRRSTAIGIWGSMASAGAATGPTVGALLIDLSSWRAIFWINIPLGVFAIVMTLIRVPESKAENAHTGLDPFGVPIATAGVAMMMFAIVQAGDWGLGDWKTLTLAVVGLLCLPISIQRARTHPRPAIDLTLFKVRSYWPAVVVIVFFGLAFLSGFLTTTLYLQELWGYSVLKTGFALSPGPIISTVVGVYSGRLAERTGHKILVVIGTACMGASYLFLAITAQAEADYLSRYLVATLLLGFGLGLSLANITGAAMSEIGPNQFAVANATSRTVQQVAYAFGIAVMVTILGTGDISVGEFRNGWILVVAMYFLAAACALTMFKNHKQT